MRISSCHYASKQHFLVGFCAQKALALIPKRLADTGSQIIGTVRDEIILEVSEEVSEEAAVIFRETMIQADKAYLSKVTVDVEVTIGETCEEK